MFSSFTVSRYRYCMLWLSIDVVGGACQNKWQVSCFSCGALDIFPGQYRLLWFVLRLAATNSSSSLSISYISPIPYTLGPKIGISPQIARFMGPTWGPPGSCRPQMGLMLAPWTLLSETVPVDVLTSNNVFPNTGDFGYKIKHYFIKVPLCVNPC